MDAGVGQRATRVLAVLALVLGMLAMHALSADHHGEVPVVLPGTGAPAAGHAAGPPHSADHHVIAAVAVAVAPLHDVAGSCTDDCSDHRSGVVLLCVAVLLAAGGALSRRFADRIRRTPAGIGPPPGGRAHTTRPKWRLDPVADLCISRT